VVQGEDGDGGGGGAVGSVDRVVQRLSMPLQFCWHKLFAKAPNKYGSGWNGRGRGLRDGFAERETSIGLL